MRISVRRYEAGKHSQNFEDVIIESREDHVQAADVFQQSRNSTDAKVGVELDLGTGASTE